MTIDRKSLIRQALSNQADTVSSESSSEGEAPMTATTLSPIFHEVSPDQGLPHVHDRDYGPLMTATPNDLAIELLDQLLLDRVANAGSDKLHKLLYYAQGHHAAITGQPLFLNSIIADENGPIIAGFGVAESEVPRGDLANSQLVSIAYVVSRYGNLSILDLQHLSMAEPPYRQTRDAGRREIELQDMVAYFKGDGAPFDGFENLPVNSDAMNGYLSEVAGQIRKREGRTGV